jgi:hypothetical protein
MNELHDELNDRQSISSNISARKEAAAQMLVKTVEPKERHLSSTGFERLKIFDDPEMATDEDFPKKVNHFNSFLLVLLGQLLCYFRSVFFWQSQPVFHHFCSYLTYRFPFLSSIYPKMVDWKKGGRISWLLYQRKDAPLTLTLAKGGLLRRALNYMCVKNMVK